MNRKNLKPFNTWEPEAHRAASVKGGIASGKARRRQAALREYISVLLEAYTEADQILKEQERQRYNARKRAERAARKARSNPF